MTSAPAASRAPSVALQDADRPSVSVVVPVAERADDLVHIYQAHAPHVAAVSATYEFVFVFDGPFTPPAALLALTKTDAHVRVLRLARAFGETGALRAGFAESRYEVVATVPAYHQVVPETVAELVRIVTAGADMATALRMRRDGWFNRTQSRAFHWLLRRLTGTAFSDIACGARAMRREVAEALPLYGDLHRFLPAVAEQQGFKVVEVQASQHQSDTRRRVYGPGVYVRRVLDIVALLFLLRFTEKPLRFFGLVGVAVGGVGTVISAVLAVQRLSGVGIANRPLLLLGVLLIALGIQLVALGLVGEIVVHWRAPYRRPHRVRSADREVSGPP